MRLSKYTRRYRPVIATGLAVAALSGAAFVTLGGFSATIVNPTNTFASGTLQLEESNG
jgi:hypothetical protein